VSGVVEIHRTRGRDGDDQDKARVTAGYAGVVIGAGLAVAALVVNAEPPCGACHRGNWGGTGAVLGLIGWMLIVGIMAGMNLVGRR
jgi:hypothetical protein